MDMATVLRGTIHGRTIELEQDSGFREGQSVSVMLRPRQPGNLDGLRQAFGAWADDAAGLEEFLGQVRRDRKRERPGPAT
jgi:hypothetical protein